MNELTLRQLMQFAWDEFKLEYYPDVPDEALDQPVSDEVVEELNFILDNLPG